MKFTLCLSLVVASLISTAQEYRVSLVNHNLSHPGLTIGKPMMLHSKTITKQKKKGPKTISKQNLWMPQVTYYNHIRKENNLSLGCEVIRQRHRVKAANWRFETGIGIHYVRSFNAGKTYQVVDGSVERIRFAGQHYFAPSISYSIGRDFFKNRPSPIATFFKPQVLMLMPYNETIVPSINIQLGIRIHLKQNDHA